MVPIIRPSTAIHAISNSFLASGGALARHVGRFSTGGPSQDDVAAAAKLSQLSRRDGWAGPASDRGALGRLQLVEHRLDAAERLLQIDDPAGLDVFEAAFHCRAEIDQMRLLFGASRKWGAVGGAGAWGRAIVHSAAPIIAERLCKILELGSAATLRPPNCDSPGLNVLKAARDGGADVGKLPRLVLLFPSAKLVAHLIERLVQIALRDGVEKLVAGGSAVLMVA